MFPEFCWSMFQHLRCETHIVPTLTQFQPKYRTTQLRQTPQRFGQNVRLLQMLNRTGSPVKQFQPGPLREKRGVVKKKPPAWMQKHPHEVAPQYVVQWVGAQNSASLCILKSYRETIEVDSFSKHVPHDDEHSEFANYAFFASVNLLSVSAMLTDVSIAWMDENISFDDCSGHICERPELKFLPVYQHYHLPLKGGGGGCQKIVILQFRPGGGIYMLHQVPDTKMPPPTKRRNL